MDTLGGRIEKLILDLAAKRGGRVTLADFGRMVGDAEVGRGEPYSKSAVSEWIQNRAEPSLAAIKAMEKVTGRDRLWIAWGASKGAQRSTANRSS